MVRLKEALPFTTAWRRKGKRCWPSWKCNRRIRRYFATCADSYSTPPPVWEGTWKESPRTSLVRMLQRHSHTANHSAACLTESQADWVVLFLVIIHIGKNAHTEVLVKIHSNHQQEKQVPIDTWMEKEDALQWLQEWLFIKRNDGEPARTVNLENSAQQRNPPWRGTCCTNPVAEISATGKFIQTDNGGCLRLAVLGRKW